MIVLTDNIKVIQKYEGKSKFDFWKDIQKGDVLTISMHLKPVGHYKPMLIVKNQRTNQTFEDAINSLQNYLDKLTFEEVNFQRISVRVKELLVDWLMEDGYSKEDAIRDIGEANISRHNDMIEIRYANDCVDNVRIKDDKIY